MKKRIKVGRRSRVRSRRNLIQPIFDFLGKPIKVDSNIVYPVRRGSSMEMKKLKVLKIESDVIHGYAPDGRLKKLTNFSNIVVV